MRQPTLRFDEPAVSTVTPTGAHGTAVPSARRAPFRRFVRGHWPALVAVAWFGLIGLSLLAPALAGGTKLGPYDLLSFFGLGQPRMPIHNNVDSDLIQIIIPWRNLAVTQVHHGELPLWNPYSGAGLPLAFNGESSTFSVPTLVSYAVPVRFSYDVTLIVKLIIAGSGTYALCRVCGTRVIGAIFAGTVYELSGAFSGLLGWPVGDVFAFLGFVLAAGVLVVRGPRRPMWVLALSLSVACAVYGGHPESVGITLIVLGLFSVPFIATRWRTEAGGVRGATKELVWRPVAFLSLGVVAGLALSAPLLLPLSQLVNGSARSAGGAYQPLPLHDSLALAFQEFDGLPTDVGHYFGSSNYYDVAAYVGVTALALAAVALVRCWRRPEVVGLVVVAIACVGILYVEPVGTVVDHLPVLRTVLWYRALIPLDFVLAVLAGRGLHEALAAVGGDRAPLRVLRWAFLAAAAVLILLFAYFLATRSGLPPGGAHERLWSFAWPAALVLSGLLITGYLLRSGPRDGLTGRSRVAGVTLLLIETGFLLWAGAPLWSSATQSFATTSAERDLQALVGTARVGFGSCPSITEFPSLGILPEANIAYGVSEFGFYEPLTPRSYYESWSRISGTPVAVAPSGVFCPSVSTVVEARDLGVRFILEPPGTKGPPGTTLVGDPGGEGLYRVPDSSIADIMSAGASTARPLAVTQLNASTWRISVHAPSPSVVHLLFTNVPGWHAALNGRPLSLTPWSGFLLQARVPAGRYTLMLHYYPDAFNVGLVVALCTLILLGGWVAWDNVRRRAARVGVTGT